MELMVRHKLSNEQESAVNRIVRIVISRILVYCNRKDLPLELQDTAYRLAEDMLKSDGIVVTPQEVANIARGDTNISYRDKSAQQKASADFLRDYESILVKYKRMKLPEVTK